LARSIYIRVLGPIRVEADGGSRSFLAPQTNALFSLLLLQRNRATSTEKLVEDLWGGRPPRSARTQLHAHVSRIRRALTTSADDYPVALETVGKGYLLRLPPAESSVDLDDFRRDVNEGRTLLERGQYSLARVCLQAALNRWYGPPFLGVQLTGVRAEARRLEEIRGGVIEDVVDADLGTGDCLAAIERLREPLAAFPYRERPVRQLITALSAAGRGVEALKVYRDYRQAVSTDLGIEPSKELQLLYRTILSGDHGHRRAEHPAGTNGRSRTQEH
jgi:DNA-binding SARP family transcriptional activator